MLSRRERERERQWQEILEAALILFSEKGYHSVTMHEIAEKAEFSIGMLYKFFKNKEDLYKTLILQKSGEINRMITNAIEGPEDEMEKLRNYVKAKGEIFQAHLPVVRLYFNEVVGESFDFMAGLNSEIRKRHGELLKSLESVFNKAIREKRFKEIADSHQLAVAIDGMTNAFFHQWLEGPVLHPYPGDPDIILNILFQGLR